jgi:tetratricopeptide (TPR) repeat protein
MAAIGAAVFVLSVVPAPMVEAAAFDRSLRTLTKAPLLSPSDAEKVADTFGLAERWQVVVPPTTLVRVRDSIKSGVVEGGNERGLPNAADALATYDRVMNGGAASPSSAAVEAELSAGTQLLQQTSNLSAMEEAVSVFTRAVQLAGSDRVLKGRALLSRALAYSDVGRWDEALADARAAEALGSTELYAIIEIEGMSLARHVESKPDLQEAARLLKATTEMESPPDLPTTGRGFAFASLAETYYHLGEFTQSIGAAKQVLLYLPLFTEVYQITSLSYLRLGSYEEATRTAREYAATVRSPASVRWLQLLEEYPHSPQLSLSLLESMRTPLNPNTSVL